MNSSQQGLAGLSCLSDEIILEIFYRISKITDKRQFLKTCKLYNNLTKVSMDNYSDNYNVPQFNYYKKNTIERFTIELCHDSYFNLIPKHYINDSNGVIVKCLSYYNNILLLEEAKINGCDLSPVIVFGAYGGHKIIIKWGYLNGCGHDAWACAYAAKGGHLNILELLLNKGYGRNH